MKYSITVLTLLSLVLLVNHATFSQTNPVPNPSFENWGGEGPTGWLTTNSDWPGSITQSAEQDGSASVKSTQVHEDKDCGGYIAKISTSIPTDKFYSTIRFFIKAQNDSGSNCLDIKQYEANIKGIRW